MSRKLANLYSESKTNSRTGHRQLIYGKDGTLFSGGTYPTKITAEDLPEWYVYGRFYKHWGYLSAAGVKHLLYIPNKWSNHMFKDDCLYISYNAPIVPNADSRSFERYTGYDEYGACEGKIFGSNRSQAAQKQMVAVVNNSRCYSCHNCLLRTPARG